DTDRGFTGLTVTNDQLTLATADRNHRVNGFHPGLKWFVYRLTLGNTWCLEFQCTAAFVFDCTEVVDWSTQWVHNTTHESVTNRYGQYVAGTVNFHTFLNTLEVSQDNDANFTWVEVLSQSSDAIVETKKFVRHNGRKTFHTGNTVSCARDIADFDTFGVGRFVRLRKLV